MPTRIGDQVPNFQALTSEGEIDLYKYLGESWGVLFSHPRDFTPVCATELGRVAQLGEEFAKRNVKPIGLSTDTAENHKKWIMDINEIMNTEVNFPIIADPDRKVAKLYGMLNQDDNDTDGLPVTVRSVFFIGPDKALKASLTYPPATGRDFAEILRVFDSLQATAHHSVATPADWVKGKDVVVLPTVQTEEAQKRFEDVKIVRPWLRTCKDPTLKEGKAEAKSAAKKEAPEKKDTGDAELRIGDTAPNFTAITSQGEIDLHKYLGESSGVLFSHPRDFTPVCATELGRVAQLSEDFAKRNVKPIGLSTDTAENHKKWIMDINEIMNTEVNFPIIADPDRKVARLYGMLHPQDHDATDGLPVTVRSVFIIGEDKKIKIIITYPPSTGRSFDEILRVLDALASTKNHSVATPADWSKGKDVVVFPTISTEDALKKFKNVKVVRPWLRTCTDPTAEPSE